MSNTATAVELPKELEAHLESYVAAFNSGDAESVNAHYTEAGIIVWEKGNPVSGADRRAAITEFLATMQPHIETEVREAYVTGDTALLVVDWTMEVNTASGAGREHLRGVGLDVLRKQADGSWLYAVDDPFGEEPRD
ncbi:MULTISPECIES: YybH family protein [unclassified Streptomyces]|uniref:YybH family protein n=1 Tax=unclassified Streptomyces TaxID=2593676 RepID=UPI0004C0EF9D|nr:MULTISPECIES: SgcJ/EcaC family oxidoreductase [unclassified Streptomyces]KOV91072.1 hydrolase [Streptomyces sp. NRRL B-3648]